MCGLIGFFNFEKKNKKTKKKIKTEPVNFEVIDQLEDQLSRGKEGFGMLRIDKQNKIVIERSTEISKILINIYAQDSNMIILHHRNPTSSENRLSQTHPLFVSNRMLDHDYYVIHNGIVSNADDLKEDHEKSGFKYNTVRTTTYYNKEEYNDSEALAIELALYIEKQSEQIEATGSAAFIVVQTNKETGKAENIFFGRKDNPLKLSGRQGEVRLSSEGKGETILENVLYRFNIKSPSLTSSKLDFVTYKNKEIDIGRNNNNTNNHNFKDKYKSIDQQSLPIKNDTDTEEEKSTTRKEIENGTMATYEDENSITEEIDDLSDKFIIEGTEIIENFALRLQEQQEIPGMDMTMEKKELAINLSIIAQKTYDQILELVAEDAYETIQEEATRRIEEEKEEEEIKENKEKEDKEKKDEKTK